MDDSLFDQSKRVTGKRKVKPAAQYVCGNMMCCARVDEAAGDDWKQCSRCELRVCEKDECQAMLVLHDRETAHK